VYTAVKLWLQQLLALHSLGAYTLMGGVGSGGQVSLPMRTVPLSGEIIILERKELAIWGRLWYAMGCTFVLSLEYLNSVLFRRVETL
jgi:hypothetical protein